jgi:hypothetical protein
MYGTLNICIYSAEIFDKGRNYGYNNASLKFKALVEKAGEESSKSHVSQPSFSTGRSARWNDEFIFSLNGETQLIVDIYESDPHNIKSVIYSNTVWNCVSAL